VDIERGIPLASLTSMGVGGAAERLVTVTSDDELVSAVTDADDAKRPLLVLGDPAQLPPIQGAGFFTNAEPDAMLTEVHRQAQDDPIVRLSMDVREGRDIEVGRYGETEVVHRSDLDPSRVMQADQVLADCPFTERP